MGSGEFTVTVPANLADDSAANLQIVYNLNDTSTSFTQDFIVEFMAPDYCMHAQI